MVTPVPMSGSSRPVSVGRRGRNEAGYPRDETGPVKSHARIRDGESRTAKLLDHDRETKRHG